MENKENLNEYQKPSILESLESHNAKFAPKITQKSNGIACPNCGKELYDRCSTGVLLSHPMKIVINCHSCDYVGTRY